MKHQYRKHLKREQRHFSPLDCLASVFPLFTFAQADEKENVILYFLKFEEKKSHFFSLHVQHSVLVKYKIIFKQVFVFFKTRMTFNFSRSASRVSILFISSK